MKRNDHHLIQQVLDGEVSQEEFDDFQQRLREEPELLKLYGEYALLQHTLCEEFEGGIRLMAPPRRSAVIPTAVAAAAVLALLAVVLFTRPWMDRNAAVDVALLTFSVDAVWKVEGSSRPIGGATGVGGGSSLYLECGRAGVSLSPTVTAILEGPAELVFHSGDSLYLKSGKGYFTVSGNGGGLALETPRIAAKDFNADFGIEVSADGAEAILVSEGELRVASQTGKDEVLLAAGDAAQVASSGAMERFSADGRRFAKALGRFRSVDSDAFLENRVDGNAGLAESGNSQTFGIHADFLRLPETVSGSENPVILTTLNVNSQSLAGSSQDGLSFMSFASKGNELLLFKDSSGDTAPIAAEKSETSMVLAKLPGKGMQTITLRYDQRTGDLSLHEGGLPLGAVICSGKIPPGSIFDEIRLGTSSGSALGVEAVDIRVGLE